ncbi:hypothetical protein JVT61DRAFT_6741 [Boletus reticuloceps]|uniref:Uncharacterized protein n=1 Tax=Boletus reticuloceps TaxID=495285 RepID=A0A8I2YIT5_9AGAM|nr:hypothetical protein JVT61DRAFT_6741 [Boletus reticuloceps]
MTNLTVENSTDSLKHLTSSLLFPLTHGVTPEDLRCLHELWGKLRLNLLVDRMSLPSHPKWDNLLALHKDDPDEAGLTRQDHFND